MLVISCPAGDNFAQKICHHLVDLSEDSLEYEKIYLKSNHIEFANTESKEMVNKSIRGKHIYIIQDIENHYPIGKYRYSVHDNYMHLRMLIDTCNRCDAGKITVVIPVYPYSRQDKSMTREGITASLVAMDMDNQRVDKILTMDLHNSAIRGFTRIANINELFAIKQINHKLRNYIKEGNWIGIAPDEGGMKRQEKYCYQLGIPVLGYFNKRRGNTGKIDKIDLILQESIENKSILIIDDILGVGDTLFSEIRKLKEYKIKKVIAAVSHGYFNGNAFEKAEEIYKEGFLDKILITDSVYHTEEILSKYPFIEIVSVARYFAHAMYNSFLNKSLTKLLT